MTEKTELKPWERATIARAMGEEPDPDDLAEARSRARATAPGWAQKAAAVAMGQRAPEQPETPAGGAEGAGWAERIAARVRGPQQPPDDAA